MLYGFCRVVAPKFNVKMKKKFDSRVVACRVSVNTPLNGKRDSKEQWRCYKIITQQFLILAQLQWVRVDNDVLTTFEQWKSKKLNVATSK